MQKHKISDLNDLFRKGEDVDNDLFPEQRSNILLVTGNHYSNKSVNYLQRLKDENKITNETKIRLTKNHIQRITKTYISNIVNLAPMVKIFPKNEKELQDQKSAELHQSVWEHIKQVSKIKQKIYELCADFIEIGECFVKVWWNPAKGAQIPIEQQVDEEGNVISETNMVSGELEFTRIYGFNMKRDSAGVDFEDCRHWICVYMANQKDLEARYSENEEKMGFIKDSSKETYRIFTGTEYSANEEGKIAIREYFFKPCLEYPKGYYYITTSRGILEEGELPAGVFPIIYAGFDRIPTSPRHQSIIKQLRPFQGEINRAASKMAEHQVTLGDDKVFIQAGTKISQGGTVSGIRGVQYTGIMPTILPGRDGSQYLQYLLSQVDEMEKVANVFEDREEKMSINTDPYSQLFASIRNKKKFSSYAEKFEQFLQDVCKVSLDLYRFHVQPKAIIPIVGKPEMVNIEEFKNMNDINYQVRIEPIDGDMDSMMGKQLAINHIMQYVGSQLQPEDIGLLTRNMPFLNKEQMLTDKTLDYDIATNTILSLDRGQWLPTNPNDNHEYMLKKLQHRMSMSDFPSLPAQVQQMYEQKKMEHQQILAMIQQEQQQANLGYIPTGGALVGVDFYENYDAADPSKIRRVKVPYEAVSWLIQRLNQQGMSQAAIDQLDQKNQADIMNMAAQQGAANQMQGAANPEQMEQPNNLPQ